MLEIGTKVVVKRNYPVFFSVPALKGVVTGVEIKNSMKVYWIKLENKDKSNWFFPFEVKEMPNTDLLDWLDSRLR